MQHRFQRLPVQAQQSAFWRLALSGLTPEQIAHRTGWPEEQIRRTMEQSPIAPRGGLPRRKRTRSPR